MARAGLFDRVGAPADAAPDEKNPKGRFCRQSERFRHRRETKVAVWRQERIQIKTIEKDERSGIAAGIERVTEAWHYAALIELTLQRFIDPIGARFSQKRTNAAAAPPWRGPERAHRPAKTLAAREAPVDAATRTAKAEALRSWSAIATSASRIFSAERSLQFQPPAKRR